MRSGKVNREPDVADELSRHSLTRLHTLTDCVFALCLLLLVVFIEKPAASMAATEEAIRHYLFGQVDIMMAYAVAFVNIAFYWFFSHNIGKYLRRSDNVHVWLTLLTLLFVGLLPFANGVNAAFPQSLTVHLFYSSMVFLVGLVFCADWLYATRKDRLVDRSLGVGTVEGLIVESLVQPIAALLSLGGAFISTFCWGLPLLLVPFAIFAVNKTRDRYRQRRDA